LIHGTPDISRGKFFIPFQRLDDLVKYLSISFKGIPDKTQERYSPAYGDLLPVVYGIIFSPRPVIQVVIVPDGIGAKEFIIGQDVEQVKGFKPGLCMVRSLAKERAYGPDGKYEYDRDICNGNSV